MDPNILSWLPIATPLLVSHDLSSRISTERRLLNTKHGGMLDMKELEDGTSWVTVLDSWVTQDAALHGEIGEEGGAEAALLDEQPNS